MRSSKRIQPTLCAPLETVVTRPPRSLSSSRPVSAKWPRWLVPNCSSKPSAVVRRGVAMTPALLTSRSSSSTVVANARTDDRSARSSLRTSTSPVIRAAASAPLPSVSRTARITFAPWAASSRAAWKPIPLLAPVTTAILPLWSAMSAAVHPAIDAESYTSMLPPGPPLPAALQTVFVWRWWDRYLKAARRRYGDVFTLRIAGFGAVVYLADADHIREVFRGAPSVMHAGEANRFMVGVLGERSVLTSDDDEHLGRRKLTSPMFHGEAVRA